MSLRTSLDSRTYCGYPIMALLLCSCIRSCSGFGETNGNIVWDPFPPEPSYQAGQMHMHRTFQDISKVAIHFIHSLPPKQLPWELYRGILNGTKDFRDPLLYVDHTVGFMVMFAIAIIFIIFMPITGTIFCCCRCCDRCGAHMLQREEDNIPVKRAGFVSGLLCVSILMTIGTGISFIANQNISSGVGRIEPSIQTNVEDLIVYVNQTVKEIDFLLDQVNKVKLLVMDKLDNVSSLVGVPVKQGLGVEVEPAIYAVLELNRDAQDAYNLLNDTNNLILTLQSQAIQLEKALANEQQELNQTLQLETCSQSSSCQAARDLIDIEKLAITTYYNETNLEDLLNPARKALQCNLTSLAISSQSILHSVPRRIGEEGHTHVQSIKQMIDDLYAGQAADIVDSARQLSEGVIDKIVTTFSPNSGGPVSEALYDGLHKAETYDQYRFYVGIAAVCIFIVIILCNYLGVLLGECGRDKRDQPTERGCLSNFGGTLLLAGVAFAFLFSSFLMLLTTAAFLVGGGVEKTICQPIQTKAILHEIIDYPHLLSSKERYILGSLFLGDGDQPLRAQKMIKQCEQNAAILTTVDTNITSMIAEVLLNYSQTSFEIESVDLSNFTSIDSDVQTSLLNIRDSTNKINVSDTLIEIKQSITQVDLKAQATILDVTAEGVVNKTLQDQLDTRSRMLESLRYNNVHPMQMNVNRLEINLKALENKTQYLSGVINQTLLLVSEADKFVREEGPTILQKEIDVFRDTLTSFLEQTADYIIYELTTDLGHCRPLANVYSSLDVVFCDYASDSLNTLWFMLGGCVILLIPSIIFAVKLSKFYRRMKFFEDIYGDNDLDTLPMKAYD
ncbi:prominin-1-A-like [Diadema setosum]|uniref:prominin-1-A-like n=1 Tax=Diadema setosum TaxID=31175 RepID=UPI003B3BE155